MFDSLLAIAQLTFGAFVLRGEVLLCQTQEVLAIRLERLVGKVRKSSGQPAGRRLKSGFTFHLQRILILESANEVSLPGSENQPDNQTAQKQPGCQRRPTKFEPQRIDSDHIHQLFRLTPFNK